MRHEHSRILLEYWENLRNGRPAPERNEIEPSDVRKILGDTFILEVSTQMRAISYRLAGTRLCAAYGRELKGLGYLAHWREEDNYNITKAINRVYNDFEPIVVSYSAVSTQEHIVEYEAVLLPLMPAADGNARILGVATPKTVPYWLGADPVIANQLHKIRRAQLEETGTNHARASLLSGSTHQMPRKKGHLMVFDGGLAGKDLPPPSN